MKNFAYYGFNGFKEYILVIKLLTKIYINQVCKRRVF